MSSIDPRDAPSDECLLSEFLAGRLEAFETLVQRYAGELFHFVSRFVGRSAAAEDVVQETLLQVHQSAAGFDGQRRFKPWLFTIAANKARDALRSRVRKREFSMDTALDGAGEEPRSFLHVLEDDVQQPIDTLAAGEQREQVRQVVEQMPEHLREVLVLGYYHQFPYKEIAETLGIPLGTVKSRLHAAVAHFATAYRKRLREAANET